MTERELTDQELAHRFGDAAICIIDAIRNGEADTRSKIGILERIRDAAEFHSGKLRLVESIQKSAP